MLFSLPSMLTALQHINPKSNLKLLDSILEVSTGNTRDASSVKQIVDKITPKYHGFEQRDAHEFISDIIDNMQEEIIKVKLPRNNISPIDIYFRMDLRIFLTCDNCQYRRSRDEVYRHLSLDITNATSVSEAISNYFQEDTVHLDCEKCSGKTATRTLQIVRLPKALLLHLKRFIVSPSLTQPFRKNKAAVDYSNTLSLRQFSCQNVTLPSSPSLPSLVQDDSTKTNPLSYSLKSLVHHIGSNANCGHYVTDAFCVNEAVMDGECWKRFDDSNVSSITRDDVVSEESKKNAYMLLYELNV